MRRSEIVWKAIELDRLHGFVTFDQLNELCAANTTTPEDLESIMKALSDDGINVVGDS